MVSAVLLFLSSFATTLVVIMGSVTTIDPCVCRIEEVETVRTRYIAMDPGHWATCTIYASCVCVCDDSEAPSHVKIKSKCESGLPARNTTKAAYHFRASVVYSGYTWERGPPSAFSGVSLALLASGILLIIVSGAWLFFIVRKTGRLLRVSESEGNGEDVVAAEA